MPDKPFRQGVLAVFINPQGKVLVGKRFGSAAAWQFPQGGIEPGETQQQALKREIGEEIGCHGFTILKLSDKPIRYEFLPGMGGPVAAEYQGQDLYWFLCQFLPGHGADLKKASDKEFDDLKWVSPTQACREVIAWKQQAYKLGLKALGIKLEPAGC